MKKEKNISYQTEIGKIIKIKKPLTIKSENVPTKEHLQELIDKCTQFIQETYYS